MARTTKSPSPLTSITISQQAVNCLRQIMRSLGWCKDITDVTIGDELLRKVLPQLDDTSWMLTEKQLAALAPEAQKAYAERDAAWGSKSFTFGVTEEQKATAAKAISHWICETAKAGKLGVADWLTELIAAFEIKPN